MGNTANNNWPYPESTDLVKDGATAIENLADAIDTTLGVYTPATPGLVLIGSPVTFSAVSAVNFTSNLSATYDNYRLVYSLTTSGTNDVFLRLRSGSTDATSTDYTLQVNASNNTTANLGRTTVPYWYCNQVATATEFSGIWDIFNPFKTQVTSTIGQQFVATGTTVYFNSCNARHNLANSYDGLSIVLSAAGTMTGQASLYAYND
jgi:hypothetical protein